MVSFKKIDHFRVTVIESSAGFKLFKRIWVPSWPLIIHECKSMHWKKTTANSIRTPLKCAPAPRPKNPLKSILGYPSWWTGPPCPPRRERNPSPGLMVENPRLFTLKERTGTLRNVRCAPSPTVGLTLSRLPITAPGVLLEDWRAKRGMTNVGRL